METQDAISRIILLIGGKENINNVWHCMTRLRFDGNDSNLLIVFYVQIMPDDFVMQLHRF
ncbi:PTS system trehalose(maltose)-specific transporter subunits IIBC [Raoultella terrigena]|uniref:PTS system trehalose(Maltose)-specific transporter subunits IIBC n=1 Tax=Raoultella terrigena TaxID=577 RepID=A0A4U9D434_RAOTE|nr:PTS system trehalose(maltose)-specific transporter subunits IIBC [Raoultella terrigena]